MAQTLEVLLDERKHKIKTLEDIEEKRSSEGDRNYSAEENEEIAKLDKDVEDMDALIQKREADDKTRAKIQARVATLSEPRDIPVTRIDPTTTNRSTRDMYPDRLWRYGKTRAFPDTREGHEAAYRSGKWIQGQLFGDPAARRWCERHDIMVTGKRTMIEGAIAAGGAVVPDEMDQQIVLLREKYGTIRQYSRNVPMGSDTKNIPRQTAGFTPYFVGEAAALTASDTTWDVITLVANKLTIMNRMSSELDEDSIISMADQFVMDAAHAFALKEDQCGFNGDATATYGGITGIRTKLLDFDGAGTDSSGVFTTGGNDSWATLDWADLEGTLALCPEYALSGDPAWYVSQVGFTLGLQRLAFGLGGSAMEDARTGLTPRLLGYPVRIAQVMPTTTAAQNLAIMFLFGDMSQACMFGNRRGIEVARDTSRYFDTDEIAMRAIERFDFVHANPGDATTPGPLVGYKGQS